MKLRLGVQHSYNPDTHAGENRGLRSSAEARADGSIDPDQCNAVDESEQLEPYPLVCQLPHGSGD
jgi:hypothetical protein